MRHLAPLSAATRVLNTAVRTAAFGFFAGMMGASFLDLPIVAVGALAGLGLLAGAGYGVARYYRFTYEVAGDTVVVRSGVFDRQEREIPMYRIQNVDLQQGVFYRLVGLTVVNLETAGGSSTEAVLDAVEREEAERIQDAVARHRRQEREGRGATEVGESTAAGTETCAAREAGSETGAGAEAAAASGAEPGEIPSASGARGRAAETAPETELLYELGQRDLLVLSLVSIRLAAPVLTLISFPVLDDVAWRAVSAGSSAVGGPAVASLEAVVGLSPGGVAVLAGVALVQFAVLSWLVSAAFTVTQFYGFRLERVGEDLRYERGLLQRYTGSIPLEKVQTITVRENVLMRPAGYAALAVETAGYAPGSGSGGASNTAVPLDDRETVEALAARLGDVEVADVERPPPRARRRYAVRFGLLAVAVTGVLLAVDRVTGAVPIWYVPLAGLALAPLAGHLRWLHRGYALTDDGLVTRTGFWRRRTRLVPHYRVQTVIDTRTVFQRWRDLATVTADTASSASLGGGDATAHDRDEADARTLHRRLRERLQRDIERRQSGGGSGSDGEPASDGESGEDA